VNKVELLKEKYKVDSDIIDIEVFKKDKIMALTLKTEKLILIDRKTKSIYAYVFIG
jgi:hypothetical protein